MRMLRWLPVLALLAVAGSAGCTKTGTAFGGGKLNRSVRLVRVPRSLEVVNVPPLRKTGQSTFAQVQIRNRSTRRKMWQFEYKYKFYDQDGRELPSATKGWRPATIGRGETATIAGACMVPGAETAVVTFRNWHPKQ